MPKQDDDRGHIHIFTPPAKPEHVIDEPRPPWSQEWEMEPCFERTLDEDVPAYVNDALISRELLSTGGASHLDNDERNAVAKLAAAAPALARALCLVEWEGRYSDLRCCPWCGAASPAAHDDRCELDAALTSAGLDAAAREAVRKGAGS